MMENRQNTDCSTGESCPGDCSGGDRNGRRAIPDGGSPSPDEQDDDWEGDGQAASVAPVDEGDEIEPHLTLWQRLYRGLRDDKRALVGAVVVLLFVLSALLAPQIAPYDTDETYQPFKEPATASSMDVDDDGEIEQVFHILGTDSFGRDIFSQIIYGSRVSLIVAFATVAFALTLGTTIGLVAGYYGGWVDSILMRYIDFQWAFPELILAVGLIAITGGTGLLNVVIAIGIAFLDDFARLIRGEVVSIREEEYVMAARSIGMTKRRIMFREILPNAIAPLIVQATIMIPIAILAEAALSFLGLGVSPTEPTWGILISNGRDFINLAPWISVIPGLAIMVTVLAFNVLGDGLRDIFDVTETEVDR
jgi:peptide/nickel transport system permease protein